MTLAYYVFAAEPSGVQDARGVGNAARDARPLPGGTPASAADPRVARLHAGDEGALRELMLEHYAALARFAASIAGPDAADDVVQDAFVAFWNARARVDPDRPVRAYLFTSVRNFALNRVKAARAVRGLSERLTLEGRAEARSAATPDDELQARSAADDDEARLRALGEVIAALPERRRTALALRFDQGLTFAEGGAVLGISAKAMQQLVIRTVAELRRVLKREPLG